MSKLDEVLGELEQFPDVQDARTELAALRRRAEDAEAMRRGEWTKNLPTKAGWYWARRGFTSRYPADVHSRDGVLYCEGRELSKWSGDSTEWWSVPIGPLPTDEAREALK